MFRYTGSGAALPIVFQEDEPLVRAQADGYDGLFGIDTGNSGATVLFGAFLTKHDFFARYPDGLATTAGGTGGLVHGSTQALGRLGIAGYTLHNFVANFVVQQRGSFSSTTEAGNIGTVILSQFTPTFDYRDRVIYFEREKDAPTKPQNRAGFGYSQSGNGVTVNVVVAKSSAAKAGIVSGDRVTAVNGTPIAAISPDALRAYTQGAAGSSLTLRIVHADETRDVVLTLHDVLCPDVPDGCPPWVEPTP